MGRPLAGSRSRYPDNPQSTDSSWLSHDNRHSNGGQLSNSNQLSNQLSNGRPPANGRHGAGSR
ncbi:lytic murein transglycosylase [Streptomyces lydicamycinicus]|uniref:Lytic murein transglycosylase n=1 Tax=Streptomyces lydicamycinicus TaxID=1546107 RepID=A0A0P4R8S8_9ACTN|nr:lytic murein transglycosylase [Streptomyces lydicamycinicus]